MGSLAGSTMRGLALATLTVSLACGEPQTPPAEVTAPSAATPSGPDFAARLPTPDVATVLSALGQPHADVREHLGAHVLHTTTDFSLTPVDPPLTTPEGEPVVVPQQVHDEVTLRFASRGDDDEAGPRLSLSQANDHDRGRDVVVADGRVHVRKAHRAWFHYPRDSDLIERWLDDALLAVHGVVELAAPQLALAAEVLDGAGLDGESAVEITLGLADRVNPDAVAAGPTQGWRRDATLTGIEGTVRLDLPRGIWLHADVDVRYRVTGANGRPLDGHVHITGTLAPDPSVTVEPPADSQPLPSRLRYDHEQRQLLDGLAAP